MTSRRLGSITAGGTAYTIRLAEWRPQPYTVLSRLVFPQFQDVPGAEGRVAGDPNIRLWHIDEWDKGEGEDLWKPGFYDQSLNVAPKRVGDGLVLGASVTTTDHDNATPADFAEGKVFGFGQGKLWAVADATVHEWQPSTDNWDETGTATGSSDTPVCIADQGDGTNLLVAYANTDAIRQVAPGGANAAVTGLSFSYAPLLLNWGGTLFWLNGDDLYSFTMSGAAATETLVSDIAGSSAKFLANDTSAAAINRLGASDKGPIWYQRLDNGQTFVHEYNVGTSTTRVLAKLPVDFAYPYSIGFAHGFYVVAFRYGESHTASGDAYLFVFRGGQKYVAGPVRSVSGASASKPVLLSGMIGDDLCFYYDGAFWAYNLTSGGIHMVSDSASSSVGAPLMSTALGQSIFLSNMSGDAKVERANRLQYSTRTATIDSGRFDFGYKGITKALLDVTVVTEPLAASTSVGLKVAADGGAFAAVTGTHETDNATSYTWTVSSSSSAVTGEDFELQLTMAGTVSATPVVRSVTARAVGVEREVLRRFEVDVVSASGGVGGVAPRSADLLADLGSLASYNGLVSLSIPWEGEEHDAAVTKEAQIVSVGHGEAEPHVAQGGSFGVIETRDVAYV